MRTAKMTFAQHSFFLILILLFSRVGIAQQNDETEKLIKEANAYMNQAEEALSENDFAGAEAAYRKAIAKDPSNTTAKYNMGNLYYNREKSGESQSRFVEADKVSESKEDRHRINHNLGNSFMKQKKYKEAVEAYKNALRNDPTDEETRYNLAIAKKKAEQMQQDQDKSKDQEEQNKKNKDEEGENKEDQQKNQDKKDNQEGDQGKDQEQGSEENKQEKKEGEGDKEKPQPDKQQQKDSGEEGKEQSQQPVKGQMSPQQMKNLLEAMENQEKEIQDKINARRAKGQPKSTDKDW